MATYGRWDEFPAETEEIRREGWEDGYAQALTDARAADATMITTEWMRWLCGMWKDPSAAARRAFSRYR